MGEPEPQREKKLGASFPDKFAEFNREVNEIAAEHRKKTCSRYVCFKTVVDAEDMGKKIDKDLYGIVAESVAERAVKIDELSGANNDLYMDAENGVGVSIKEEFYVASSKNRLLILVYGSHDNRDRFAISEGLPRL